MDAVIICQLHHGFFNNVKITIIADANFYIETPINMFGMIDNG